MAGKKRFDMDTVLDAAMIQFWRPGMQTPRSMTCRASPG